MSENVWTLMVFGTGQVQAIVLQYKGKDHVQRDRDLLLTRSPERVSLKDDYGRELVMYPADAMMVLIQDVDQAAEGNVVANVKNGVAQAVTQVRTEDAIKEAPEMKSAMARARLTSNMAGANGPFRA